MKLFIVVPVVGLVFLAISAYREIPNIPDKQAVPVILTEKLFSTNLLSAPSKVSVDVADKSSGQPSSSSRLSAIPAPPQPAPPPPSDVKENTGTAKENEAEKTEPVPYVVVEEMPMFPGGDTELLRYIAEHTNYPETAKVNNIQGRVIIRFCVTEEGGVNLISVLKGVDPALDAEALRVVATLPTFNPGKQGGKAVPVWYMVPITFTLK